MLLFLEKRIGKKVNQKATVMVLLLDWGFVMKLIVYRMKTITTIIDNLQED